MISPVSIRRSTRSRLRRSTAGARNPWPSPRAWLLFAAQALFVVMVDAGNDIFRGNIHPANAVEAVGNAREVARFEAAHGFFIEPALQQFFLHTQTLLGLVVTPSDTIRFTNGVYGFAHIFVTLFVAAWIYARHRDRFPLVRNVMILTNALAVIGYEVFPMAPPRLTTGLMFQHHLFHFQDTMQHIIGSGKLNGIPIGYNAYSAMPSAHAAWALIMGFCVVWLARNPLLRVLGALYPVLMVFTIVVTGNHYLLDAVGGAIAVGLAAVTVLGLSTVWKSTHCTGGVLESAAQAA